MNPYSAAIGIKRTYVNGEFVGSRLRAAIPNKEGKKWKSYVNQKRELDFYIKQRDVTSFDPKFLILQGSDLPFILPDDVQRFLKSLERLGYKDFQFEPEVIDIARPSFVMGV